MSRSSGDRHDHFARLYADAYGAIRAYAVRRLGSDAADEIAAETFLIAWRRFDDLPPEPLPWLYGVARNVVARHREAAGRQQRVRVALERERPAVTDDLADGDRTLWEAWERLSDGDQEVLALIAWEDLAIADAARVVGCSAPVFSVRLHRARRRLERLLTQSEFVTPQPVEA